MKLRKASTIGVIWVAETINEQAHQYLNGPAHVQCQDIGFHVLQKVGADQFTQMRHGGKLRFAGL
eukprot:1192708-Pleurochrysis_carterae.AAC.1